MHRLLLRLWDQEYGVFPFVCFPLFGGTEWGVQSLGRILFRERVDERCLYGDELWLGDVWGPSILLPKGITHIIRHWMPVGEQEAGKGRGTISMQGTRGGKEEVEVGNVYLLLPLLLAVAFIHPVPIPWIERLISTSCIWCFPSECCLFMNQFRPFISGSSTEHNSCLVSSWVASHRLFQCSKSFWH